jgi:hypothetical protein
MSEQVRIHAKTGLQHGLINTVGNSVPDSGGKRFAEKDRAAMEKKKKEDEKIVTARYLNKAGGVERLERPYCMWDGQPITMWRFFHGEIYDVPKGLIDDVNSPHKRPKKRSGLLDNKGNPLLVDTNDDPEHSFVPVGF